MTASMKRTERPALATAGLLLLSLLAFSLLLPAHAQVVKKGKPPPEVYAGIIVKYKSSSAARATATSATTMRAVEERARVKVAASRQGAMGVAVYRFDKAMPAAEVRAAAARMALDPGVEYAVPDQVMYLMQTTPNDTEYAAKQWTLQAPPDDRRRSQPAACMAAHDRVEHRRRRRGRQWYPSRASGPGRTPAARLRLHQQRLARCAQLSGQLECGRRQRSRCRSHRPGRLSRRCRAGTASTEPRAATPAEHLARHTCGRHDRRDRQQWRGHRRRRLECPTPAGTGGWPQRCRHIVGHHRRHRLGRRACCAGSARKCQPGAGHQSQSRRPRDPAVPPTRMSSIASEPSVRWSWRRPAMTERWSSRSRPTATASLR